MSRWSFQPLMVEINEKSVISTGSTRMGTSKSDKKEQQGPVMNYIAFFQW